MLVSHSAPVTALPKYEKNNTGAGMCLANLLLTSLACLVSAAPLSYMKTCTRAISLTPTLTLLHLF